MLRAAPAKAACRAYRIDLFARLVFRAVTVSSSAYSTGGMVGSPAWSFGSMQGISSVSLPRALARTLR